MKRKTNEQVLHDASSEKRRELSHPQLDDLPMNVLSNIVSWLPIKDAIRTSVLSRQWRHVWCEHTKLTFDYFTLRRYCFNPPRSGTMINAEGLISRVDSVLQQHCGLGVELMQIRYPLRDKHAGSIDRWVKFAIASKTKELNLILSHRRRDFSDNREGFYSFPCQLFDASNNGSHLRCLQLTAVSLQPTAHLNGFLNLTRLNLVDVNITNEAVQYFLSKCNFLEFLDISFCRMLTTIHVPHPLNRLRHLQVENCPLLKKIYMNCGLTTFVYTGVMISLIFATTSSLANVCITLTSYSTALDSIITGFISTLPNLRTLNLHCVERERAIFPLRLPKFIYLRHLRLELINYCHKESGNTDVLDFAYLLEVAPFMEKLELHMWMAGPHRPYHVEDGELRRLTLRQHEHLKWVYMSGFFGCKDQLELALHILRSSAMLNVMKIDPMVLDGCPPASSYRTCTYVDYMVAMEFVRKEDHANIVKVVRAPIISQKEKKKLHIGALEHMAESMQALQELEEAPVGDSTASTNQIGIEKAPFLSGVRCFTNASWEDGVTGIGIFIHNHNSHGGVLIKGRCTGLSSVLQAELQAILMAKKVNEALHYEEANYITDNQSLVAILRARDTVNTLGHWNLRPQLAQLFDVGNNQNNSINFSINWVPRGGNLFAYKLATEARQQRRESNTIFSCHNAAHGDVCPTKTSLKLCNRDNSRITHVLCF